MDIIVKFLISGLLGVFLWRLAIIDLRTFRLPDIYTLTLILVGVLINAFIASGVPHNAVWGAVIGYSIFWGLGSWFFTRTGREGLGLGDAKLLAAAGAWVGITYLPAVLFLAAGSALIVALAKGTKAKEMISFGPWLATAFWIVWVAKLIELPHSMSL